MERAIKKKHPAVAEREEHIIMKWSNLFRSKQSKNKSSNGTENTNSTPTNNNANESRQDDINKAPSAAEVAAKVAPMGD